MKKIIIPAQVTDVEDLIIGSLTFTQLALIASPVLISFILLINMPPFCKYASYKLIVIMISAVLGIILSLRINEKILFFWILIIINYNRNPKYYVFKKSTHIRQYEPETAEDYGNKSIQNKSNTVSESTPKRKIQSERLIKTQSKNLYFNKNTQGLINVCFKEVE